MGTLYNVSSTTGDITTAGSVISNTTTSGLLFPRLTTVQRNAISSPSAGMQIYNTDTNMDEFYNGTVWGPISSGGGTPGGSNTQIQYNNSGAFGASASFTWNDTTKELDLFSPGNKDTSIKATDALFLIGSQSTQINLGTAFGNGLSIGDNGTDTQVAINGTGTPAASAVLDLGSSANNLGFLPPRMTTTQRTSIASPAEGLIVYDTTLFQLWEYQNGAWAEVGGGSPAGSSGQFQYNNSGVFGGTPALILGTTSDTSFNHPIVFDRTNGAAVLSIDAGTGQGVIEMNTDTNSHIYFQTENTTTTYATISANATPNSLQLASANGEGVFVKDNGTDTQVAINATGTPDASAVLDLGSTVNNLGFLPPRLTTTLKDAISSPASGLVVYDSTLNKLSVWTGAAWETVTSS